MLLVQVRYYLIIIKVISFIEIAFNFKKMQPNKFKYTKLHKKKFRKIKYKTLFLKFGTVGLKALESGFISAYQLKSIKFVLSKNLKRKGKIWFNAFPNIPVTAKPIEVRMGKGKGNLKHWSFFVTPGFIILEVLSNLNRLSIAAILKEAIMYPNIPLLL